MGVRIEHPQPLIDRIQYGRAAGHPDAAGRGLPARVHARRRRGVFSFCMCPGGWIVPAATEPDGVVVNGMSLSRRDSPYANSGLVVVDRASPTSRGSAWRSRSAASSCSAGSSAPRRPPAAASCARPRPARPTSCAAARRRRCRPRATSPASPRAIVGAVLDATGLPLAARLREALAAFDRQMRGYLTDDAVLVGVESRTSSPVRVPRDRERLESPDLAGLYPCGEGAGYAGGIVSARARRHARRARDRRRTRWIACVGSEAYDVVRMTDEEVATLLRSAESDRVERKESLFDRVRKAICAFANDLAGHRRPSVVVVGQRDDGSCANLKIDDHRIEVLSPGGPFGQVTIERFGSPGLTDYRNPHVAEALKVLGFVERFGVGLTIANKRLATNGNPPLEYEVETSYVLVRLRRSSP